MGVPEITTMDDSELHAEDCEELVISAVAVDRLLSNDICLVDQLDDCGAGAGDEDDDQASLTGTFIGDDDSDEMLLSGRTLVDVEESVEERPSLFNKRSDSMCSSFSMRETITSPNTPVACTCGRAGGDGARPRVQSASEEYLDASLRYGLSVRVIGIESAEMNSRFLLRVEDFETKKHWEVRKNTKEMAAFYNQIRHICMEQAPVKKEMWGTFRGLRKLRLPKKFLHSRGALCYQRRVVYDSLLRHTAALVAPAPLGPRRRQVVTLLQEFLNVSMYCDVSDREVCNCCFFSSRVNASQLINEIFSETHHPINRECAEFVGALTKKSHETRRTKLYPQKAQAILRTIAKKMTEVKKSVLSDVTLLQQVGTLRHEMPENEFDDFVDEVRRAASGFVQKAILVELEDHVHEALHVLYAEEEEKLLLPKMRVLQDKRPSLFGVPAHLQKPHDWDDARVEIRRMGEYSLPLDKLQCILRASSAIFRTCTNGAAEASCLAPALCTDDFLQILFYVVATSKLARPLRTVQMIRQLCDQDDLTGEMGYYFANFEAAVKLVEEHADWSATVMDQM